jgi:putative mRNA 3-end processing factor
MGAIDATGAQRVLVTHGYRDPVVRVLQEKGIEAEALASRWEGEGDNEVDDVIVPDDESTPA